MSGPLRDTETNGYVRYRRLPRSSGCRWTRRAPRMRGEDNGLRGSTFSSPELRVATRSCLDEERMRSAQANARQVPSDASGVSSEVSRASGPRAVRPRSTAAGEEGRDRDAATKPPSGRQGRPASRAQPLASPHAGRHRSSTLSNVLVRDLPRHGGQGRQRTVSVSSLRSS